MLKDHPKLQSALGVGANYTEKLPFDQKIYSQYYVQDDSEVGILMDSKIPIKEVKKEKTNSGRYIGNCQLVFLFLHAFLLSDLVTCVTQMKLSLLLASQRRSVSVRQLIKKESH